MSNSTLVIALCALCLFLREATADVQVITLLPQGEVTLDQSTATGECVATDLLADEGRLPGMTAQALATGRYEATFRLRVSHTIDRNIARIRIVISAHREAELLAEHELSMVNFELPGRYQDFRLPFTLAKGGNVSFRTRFVWDGLRGSRRPYPQSAMPDAPGDAGGVEDGIVLVRELADRPWHLALEHIVVSPPHSVVVEGLELNKVRYLPGDEATVSCEIVNYSLRERRVAIVVDFIREMATVYESRRVELVLEAGERQQLQVTAPLTEARWGREARVRILEGETELHRASEYATVHDNPWAVAIGAYGINLAYYRAGKEGEKAEEQAARVKRAYGNTIEFVFWAEDDFGNLNPSETPYWSGQMRHQGGAESTRQLIEAFRRAGIASSFYALYIVADGHAGYELYRKNPNWFRPAFYDVSHLDRWHRSEALISWPRLSVRADTPEPYRHHAEEIIRSVADFGWDAIRYDTDMSVKEMAGDQPHVAKYFPETKARVNAVHPKFQWGYNDALHRMNLNQEPELQQLYATLCEGGGMIMDEYNNHAFQDRWTYERYAMRHRHIRDSVHGLGGHFTLCPFDLDWINDQVYQGILPLVARAHHAWDPHRGSVPYANYHQFSTRYAGAIWDNAAIVLPGALDRVDWGAATDQLFHPDKYSYLRPLGEGRSDLIIHLVNQPPERACSYDDNRVSPPLTDIAGSIALPAGLTVRGVYAASAEPELYQQSLPFTLADGKLSFVVPKLRFWTMVVVELEGEGRWQ